MESPTLNQLAEKYWQGTSTVQEEQELKMAVLGGKVPSGLEPLAEYLQSMEAQSNCQLDEAFDAEMARAADLPRFLDALSPHNLAMLAGGHAALGEIDTALDMLRGGLRRGGLDLLFKDRFGSSAGPVAETEPFQAFLVEYEAERQRLAEIY